MKAIKISDKQSEDGPGVSKRRSGLLSGGGVQRSRLPVIPFLLVHFTSMFPEVFVALHVELHEVADFDWVDLPSAAVAYLVHSFPEDVFVFVLVDVFALIVRFDGELHLLHSSLLGVQLLQVLIRVFALIVPSRVSRAPSHSGQSRRHDGGWGLCTATTHGGVQVRRWGFGAANQWKGAVEDELRWAQTRRRRERRRGRDL